jgi:hypothetical protein
MFDVQAISGAGLQSNIARACFRLSSKVSKALFATRSGGSAGRFSCDQQGWQKSVDDFWRQGSFLA